MAARTGTLDGGTNLIDRALARTADAEAALDKMPLVDGDDRGKQVTATGCRRPAARPAPA